MDLNPTNPQQQTTPTPPAPMPSPVPAQPTNSVPTTFSTNSEALTPPASSAQPPAPMNSAAPAPSPVDTASQMVQPQVSPVVETNPPTANSLPTEAATAPQPEVTAAPTQPNQMQTPTVFDTNQYHLPIQKPKKHNPGKQMLVFGIVFLIVVVVGGLIAIDAGLIDLGFKAPFDLIK